MYESSKNPNKRIRFTKYALLERLIFTLFFKHNASFSTKITINSNYRIKK
jgi:hypothetical protein